MTLSRNSQRVQNYLNSIGIQLDVVELAESTRTAQEAAQAVHCDVAQIVKSMVFRSGNNALLFLVSGKNLLNVDKVSQSIGKTVEKADAEFAREKTGYPIGGVPPVAHDTNIETYIDEELLNYPEVWAAAGTPNAVFCIKSNDLPRITGGKVIALS